MSRRWPESTHSKIQVNRTPTVVPRPFLPPSYYADAGGIPYPRKQPSTSVRDVQGIPSSERNLGNRIPRLRPPPPPVASESDSSFETRNGAHYTARDVPSSHHPRPPSAKRQGIPNAEEQLLPSLQSTIHRMTRPPSRILAESTNFPPIDIIQDGSKRKSTSNYKHPETTAPHDTPKSRIPQKSALKSAMRTNAKPPVASTDHTTTPTPSSPRRNSLRSMKTLLSRKLGNAPSQITAIPPPETPSSSSQQRDDRNNMSHPPTYTSHLPRPRFKLEQNQATPAYPQQPSSHSSLQTDESDLENSYQRQWMERRRLTVANAEVVPSGSSSGSSMNSSFDILKTPKPTPYHQRTEWKKPNNALGFDLHMHTSSVTAPNSPLLPNIEVSSDRDKTKILRFSLPPSGSDASLYSNHQLSYPGSWGDSDHSGELEDKAYYGAGWAAQDPGNDTFSGDEPSESESEGGNQYRDHPSPRTSNRSSFENDRRQDLSHPRESEVPYGVESKRHGRSRLLAKAAADRFASQDYQDRPGPDYRRTNPRHADPPGSPWTTAAPTPSRERVQPNAWFDESSGEYAEDADFDHIRATPHRRAPAPPGFEMTSISQEWKRQATQQREAFGLPPSTSDEDNARRDQRWSHSDSYRSSVASSRWDWNAKQSEESREKTRVNISLEAENMIKNLHPEWSRAMPVISTASSVASFYDDQNEQFDTATEDLSRETSYEDTPRPMQFGRETTESAPGRTPPSAREGIILEFIQTEEVFLTNTQLCVDFFILPIRTENSRSWIKGVPSSVSRLLDWYEDIVNLHLAVYQSLESSSSLQETDTVVAGLANYLADFVGKLHVYQPYLVCLADVLEEVACLASDSNNDFGEFIRIQENLLKSKGWTFEQLLVEPVNRLGAYQDLFSNLVESTPQDHPEFLTTMRLSRSADTAMRVMTEVKVRETEHRLIQSLASQISDPGVAGVLSSRDRRLLHSGTLRLVSPALNLAANNVKAQAQKRSSKLAHAISQWDKKPERSSSLKSTASSATTSVRSFSTTSSFGPPPSLDPRSAKMPLLRGLFKGKAAEPGRSASQAGFLETAATVPLGYVQVFVFSDLVLMVLPKPTIDSKYTLVPKLGLAKVFSVSTGGVGEAAELHLALIPITCDSVKSDSLPRSASIADVVLALPDNLPEHQNQGDDTVQRTLDTWSTAFQRCSEDTMQLLSCPAPRKAVPSERSKETWLAVSSLVSSGLPMPKSPSGQFPDLEYSRSGQEAREVEREERGWWSLRYQQVLGEMVHVPRSYLDGEAEKGGE
ncbi:hypothetical protein DFP72DRAFT_935979 [Ephemerocybe angulata]|uniref:DH domain-containing protein n=1 Tax=Ephemerocybe angulata TaxID=980116 RepID=A0A8H6LU80_9AGAR|nr:hypothetical protein DFP72DRAFT_935979 [Tulosesus angulatus]